MSLTEHQLKTAFGSEFFTLNRTETSLVTNDFRAAVSQDDIDAFEYRRRIGGGNLKSYATILSIQAKNRRKTKCQKL